MAFLVELPILDSYLLRGSLECVRFVFVSGFVFALPIDRFAVQVQIGHCSVTTTAQ